ncbi:DUF1566 domain-containing protein [Turneriella parva]|uniref:Lcl C-terminal domain-containing protein n=1 Tax=Turneriella parva TaxID=29510 RepID=UPI001FE0A870|nr:DUF1566 domain-containing protein [Turneriella parva]
MGNSITAPLQQIFMTTTRNVVFPVSDTGQTTCYDDTTAQACPVATHPGQDADYADTPNSRSFTGPTQNATFNTDYTTTDNSTGLIWKTCTEGLTGATCTGGSATSFTSWFNTVNPCSTLNAANGGVGYAQINTWRLPTSREAATLKNYELANPTLEAIPFPATIAGQYRSATTSLASLNFAGHYYFNAAAIAASNMGNPGYVRCVASGASNPVRNFSDNTDGTVTDVNANLRWQKCTRGQNNDASCTGAATASTWQLALQYCDGLTLGDTGFANRANWRLPNVKELESLIDRSVNSPAISTAFFPATLSNYYWTSSTVAGTPTNAWRIRGDIDNSVKTSAHYARCVATGP